LKGNQQNHTGVNSFPSDKQRAVEHFLRFGVHYLLINTGTSVKLVVECWASNRHLGWEGSGYVL